MSSFQRLNLQEPAMSSAARSSGSSSDFMAIPMDDIDMTHTGKIIPNGGAVSSAAAPSSSSDTSLASLVTTDREYPETFSSQLGRNYRNERLITHPGESVRFPFAKSSSADNNNKESESTPASPPATGENSSRESPVPFSKMRPTSSVIAGGVSGGPGHRSYPFLYKNNPEAIINHYQESEKLKKARQKKKAKEGRKDKGVIVYKTKTETEEEYDPDKVLELLGEAPAAKAKEAKDKGKKAEKKEAKKAEKKEERARKKKEASPTNERAEKANKDIEQDNDKETSEDELEEEESRVVKVKEVVIKKDKPHNKVLKKSSSDDVARAAVILNEAASGEGSWVNDAFQRQSSLSKSIENLASFTTVTKKKKKKNANNVSSLGSPGEEDHSATNGYVTNNNNNTLNHKPHNNYRPAGANYASTSNNSQQQQQQRSTNSNRDNSYNKGVNSPVENGTGKSSLTNGDLPAAAALASVPPQSPPATSSSVQAAAKVNLDLGSAAFPALAPAAASFAAVANGNNSTAVWPVNKAVNGNSNAHAAAVNGDSDTSTSITHLQNQAVIDPRQEQHQQHTDNETNDTATTEQAHSVVSSLSESHTPSPESHDGEEEEEYHEEEEEYTEEQLLPMSSSCAPSGPGSLCDGNGQRDISSRNSAASFFLDADNHVEIVTNEEEFNRRSAAESAPVVIMSRGEASYEDWTGAAAAAAAGQVEFGFDINEDLLSSASATAGCDSSETNNEQHFVYSNNNNSNQQHHAHAHHAANNAQIGVPMSMDQFMAAAVAAGAQNLPVMPPSVPMGPAHGPAHMGVAPLPEWQQEPEPDSVIEDEDEDTKASNQSDNESSGRSTPVVVDDADVNNPVSLANYVELVSWVANSWDRVEKELSLSQSAAAAAAASGATLYSGSAAESLGVASH